VRAVELCAHGAAEAEAEAEAGGKHGWDLVVWPAHRVSVAKFSASGRISTTFLTVEIRR
jgi:hypothetical protein